MMLHDADNRLTPGEILFKFAIFMGSQMPFAKTVQHGIDTRRYFGLYGAAHQRAARPGCKTEIPPYLVADASYLAGEADLQGLSALARSETFYQMFHATVDEVRITVPVAHIYGRRDPWILHSKELVALCSKITCFQMEHDGGHEIPREIDDQLCDLVESVVYKAGFL